MPVETLGCTAALTEMSDSAVKSASTVGFPRLSKISRPWMVLIMTCPASTVAMASSDLLLLDALIAAALILASMGPGSNAQ